MFEHQAMNDARYEELLHAMQRGEWSEAQTLLEDLKQDYPDDPDLATIAFDMQCKSRLSSYWSSKLTARLPHINGTRVLRWVVGVFVIGLLIYEVLMINTNLLKPTQEVQAEAMTVQQLMIAGDQAFADGQYEDALMTYEQILELEPKNAEAKAAIARTQEKIELSTKYEEALKAIDNLNYTRAQQLLLEIKEKDPHFKDVAAILPSVSLQSKKQTLFYTAEMAYERQQWTDAIAAYEEMMSIDATFHAGNVKAHLMEAYQQYARYLLAKKALTLDLIEEALNTLRKEIRLDPDNRTVLEQVTLLTLYKQAFEALQQQDYDTAAPLLEQIMQQPYDILGDHVTQDLYTAYLGLGDIAMSEGETMRATDYYAKAVNLPLENTTEAELRLEVSMAGIPPTPTPTPTPTSTPAPPTPTPIQPTPTPAPITWYKGWIAFISDRDGDEGLFVMRPDGRGVRRLNDEDRVVYDEIHEREQWSPDGTTHVYAEVAGPDRQDTDIFIFRNDLPETWERRFRYTDWGSMEYDPVWSPDNQWIAFVSNKTGNDEIWLMRSDGSDKTQLTFNDWEWDKHPTWSPDSQYIAFMSNRETGRLQIWIMNLDGSGQQNISNNDYNDHDPVWIK